MPAARCWYVREQRPPATDQSQEMISILCKQHYNNNNGIEHRKLSVVVHFGGYNKCHWWVAYKQHEFIAHHFGGWEVWDQGASSQVLVGGPIPCSASSFSLCPHTPKEQGALWTTFIRALIPFWRSPPSRLKHLQGPHLLTPSHWALGFTMWIVQGCKHSDHT